MQSVSVSATAAAAAAAVVAAQEKETSILHRCQTTQLNSATLRIRP